MICLPRSTTTRINSLTTFALISQCLQYLAATPCALFRTRGALVSHVRESRQPNIFDLCVQNIDVACIFIAVNVRFLVVRLIIPYFGTRRPGRFASLTVLVAHYIIIITRIYCAFAL